MSSKRKVTAPVVTQVEDEVEELQQFNEQQDILDQPQAQVAVIAEIKPKVRMQMRGRSLVQSPVALVWLICHNAMSAARLDGKERPSRKALFDLCIEATIAPYTARTQIQAYLKASGKGQFTPTQHPKNLSFE